MSRIGRLPINIPEGVEVKIDGRNVEVSGPKGKMSEDVPEGVTLKKDEDTIEVNIESQEYKNMWGLGRTLLANMVKGVTEGFKKELLFIGVGYNAKVEGNSLILNLGLSHPVEYKIPEGVEISFDKDPKGNLLLIVSGMDKQLVGQVAAEIRGFKQPEPYKGKGIRYKDEKVIMKAGKAAKK